LADLFIKQRREKLNKKLNKERRLDSQIEETDKIFFQQAHKRSEKKYNLTQTAKILGVHRETMYYWIKKKWINPKRDFKNYPVFTVLDIEELIEWRNTIKQ